MKPIFSLMLFFCFAVASLAQAGSMVSGGAMIPAPWYTGNEPVEYCTRVSKTFSIPEAEVKEQVNKTFSFYINKVKFKKKSLPTNSISTTNFVEVECAKGASLVLSFGIDPDPIQKVYLRIPLFYFSVNLKVDYNEAKNQVMGLIWIPDDVSNPSFFEERGLSDYRWSENQENFRQTLHSELEYVFGLSFQ
jgi:hypothetical protein